MQYVIGTVNATAGLNVRGGPGTSYPILGALPYKTPVEGWLDAGFIKINYQGKDGYLMAQFVTYTVAEPPEPPKPPAGDIDIDMTLKSDGSIQGTWKDV